MPQGPSSHHSADSPCTTRQTINQLSMRPFISLLVFLLTATATQAQDSIRYRIIFIGDAGEMDPQQHSVMDHAAAHIIANKTSVMYLGDNIYPRGMGLPGSKEEETTKQILRSQYQPMRSKGAPVYFIPGNHDWDRMGPKGLAKIKRQWEFLDEQNDSLLKMIPRNGCPDPVAINVSDSLVIIAFDSEWWVYTYDKRNPDADCDCRTKADIVTRMNELLYKNRYKVILLASHHPFQSYGTHGGYFSWKDHLFPLTAVNHNLYIPLPVIGSLYPFLRSTFTNPEDLGHPLYKDMIKNIDGVFTGFPNLIHVAGHEHGLQFIKNESAKNKPVQVISGAGAKNTYATKGKHSLFADATQGYVTADLLTGNSMRFTYYIYTDTGMRTAFTYTQPYTSVSEKEDSTYQAVARTPDSLITQVRPVYDSVSKLHRKLFGENYRKEWAIPTKLPVLRISELHGGLTPLQRGGGMQSISLRLVDKNNKEWVLRSVEKNPDPLLPEELRETFARDLLDDAMSAQHPFSALIVPPIADAVNVPHANPVIGVLVPDKNLGYYAKDMVNKVFLLEEREPLGESDNSIKMERNLVKDNDNSFKQKEFLRARMLDLLIADWDRHEDQWRWKDDAKGKDKEYIAVPRDRDQVLHLTEGWLPWLAARRWIMPTLQGFDSTIHDVHYAIFKSRFLNAAPAAQINHDQWTKQVNDFTADVTNPVLEAGLQRLPKEAYQLRHDELLKKLEARRNNIPAAMEEYYRFINKIADIQLSNKNELVEISDAPNNALRITVKKISKDSEIKELLMDKTYDPAFTKEIRLYLSAGNDSLIINNKQSTIKLRIIGGQGNKTYNVAAATRRIDLYDIQQHGAFSGDSTRFKKHLSNDSSNTAFVPVNNYNVTMPLVSFGINADDGFLLALGFKHIQQEGFRKTPYANVQSLIVGHSFSTKAYRAKYNGEWLHAFGKADFTLQAVAKAPNNTINFFGRGNETEFYKAEGFNYKHYYRTRFSTYLLDAAFRWRTTTGTSISIGPTFQYYRFEEEDKIGRFINNTSLIKSYDSATINKAKLHAGVAVTYISDKRNNPIMPTWGSYINIRMAGYAGLNTYAKSYGTLVPEIDLYKSITAKGSIVLAERLGGGITIGKSAFYQSMFLGGQENLLGYRQYRFAGQHSMYNNLELRIKVATFGGYILPGQFGIIGFHDIGRVWEKEESSSKWHNGYGGGIYYAPASLAVFKFVMGNSTEGWYPYITMGMRF